MQSNKNLNLNYSNPDEKGFTLVRTDIIQLWVWLEGYSPLDDQPLKSLSEDISYRIRETLDVIYLKFFISLNILFHSLLECCQLYATLQTFQTSNF